MLKSRPVSRPAYTIRVFIVSDYIQIFGQDLIPNFKKISRPISEMKPRSGHETSHYTFTLCKGLNEAQNLNTIVEK
jgi:hypothetical protein